MSLKITNKKGKVVATLEDDYTEPVFKEKCCENEQCSCEDEKCKKCKEKALKEQE